MYRPTIRCSDAYKDYFDALTNLTGLDRNQLIRLALFSAPFSKLFVAQLEQKTGGVSLPPPSWEVFDHDLWMEQNPKIEKGGGGVNAKHGRTEKIETVVRDLEPRRETNERNGRQRSEPRRERQIHKGSGGGIRITIG